MATLVVYVMHEYTSLVKNFINKAIFKDVDVDFVIVCNNRSLTFNVPSYVSLIYRENRGHDFGAWSEGLLKRKKDYDYYICVNSTANGPFLSNISKKKWTDVYINGVTNDVKLFGSTINCCTGPWCKQFPYWSGPHVQTYIFSMTHETLLYLSSEGIFSLTEYTTDKIQTVFEKEIGLSKKILDKGWNIGCLMNKYASVDFRITNDIFADDVMYPQFENIHWTREELIFIKGNR
jgi:hypothetical protein